jgi:hypothetical protein
MRSSAARDCGGSATSASSCLLENTQKAGTAPVARDLAARRRYCRSVSRKGIVHTTKF